MAFDSAVGGLKEFAWEQDVLIQAQDLVHVTCALVHTVHLLHMVCRRHLNFIIQLKNISLMFSAGIPLRKIRGGDHSHTHFKCTHDSREKDSHDSLDSHDSR